MRKNYESPEFDFYAFRFKNLLAGGELVVSDPQIPGDDYNPGEVE